MIQYLYIITSLTSTLANLSVASPEDSDERGSVVRSCFDVVVLSEEDVVTVFDTAETSHKHNVQIYVMIQRKH